MGIVAFHVVLFVLPFLIVSWEARRRQFQQGEFSYLLLLYFLLFGVGVQALVTGLVQIFIGEGHSEYVNRPWSPYVWEVGMMNLSYAAIAFLCIWLRGSFWAAVGLGYSIFLFLAFIGHMYEAAFHYNYSLGNIGPQVWIDLATGIVLCCLILRRQQKMDTE